MDSNHPARTTSFAEVDLSTLTDPAYYAALFSARALAPGGLAETIARGSRDFAVGLGDRLRGRICEHVVPRIVRAVADELERSGERPESRDALAAVCDATLALLYRLLFVLYAEAREYLPVTASAGYREHSLRKRIDAIVATAEGAVSLTPALPIFGATCARRSTRSPMVTPSAIARAGRPPRGLDVPEARPRPGAARPPREVGRPPPSRSAYGAMLWLRWKTLSGS